MINFDEHGNLHLSPCRDLLFSDMKKIGETKKVEFPYYCYNLDTYVNDQCRIKYLAEQHWLSVEYRTSLHEKYKFMKLT